MASENETVMDVCAEWRDCIESADPSVWNDRRIAGLVKTYKVQQIAYLDRVEAAWKREHEPVTGSHTVGNSAATRSALETLLNLALVVKDENSDCGPKTKVPEQFIIDVARSAISAPARNCDKMPDIDNLTMHDLANSPCKSTLEYASREELLALVRWLLAPAAERKGER